MNWEKLKGIKYYLAYAFILLAFYTYSGIVGLQWLKSTPTQEERTERTRGAHGNYIYHK